MNCIDCRTQAELDAALRQPDACPRLIGNGYFVVWDSSHVTARDSSHVTAWGSSHVTAWDSSQVTAWDSSQVTARGSSQVTARGSSQVTAGAFCAVTVHGKRAKVKGGHIIVVPRLTDVEPWCEWYGIKVTGKKARTAHLYKAVDDNYLSGHGTSYAPGSKPEAEDWDGGLNRCGGGLHFSPTPGHALGYAPTATRFVRCPVLLSDLAVIHTTGESDKVKARKVTGKIVEVDRNGEPIEGAS